MKSPIPYIQQATADYYGLHLTALLGPSREICLARPRQLAMALSYEHTKASHPMVGRRFNRDHTTVIHARRKIEEVWDENVARDALKIMLTAHAEWSESHKAKPTQRNA